VIIINLFNIISEEFFKPLTSKYKSTYIDCIRLIYNTYKTELSFGVDKEIILSELEHYFDNQSSEDMVFDEDEEISKDYSYQEVMLHDSTFRYTSLFGNRYESIHI